MSLTENILEGLYVLTNLSAGKTEITRKQLNNKGKKRIGDEILMPCFKRNAKRNSFEKKKLEKRLHLTMQNFKKNVLLMIVILG